MVVIIMSLFVDRNDSKLIPFSRQILTLLFSEERRKTQVLSMRFPCIVDFSIRVLCDVILRHNVYAYRSAILLHGKNMLNNC